MSTRPLLLVVPTLLIACQGARSVAVDPAAIDGAAPSDAALPTDVATPDAAPDTQPDTRLVEVANGQGALCFAFELPAGFDDVTGPCADSFCGEHVWGERRLSLDFGAYENVIGPGEVLSEEDLVVDGLTMSLTTVRVPSPTAYFFSLRHYETPLKLTIHFKSPELADRAMALAVFQSIVGIAETIRRRECVPR